MAAMADFVCQSKACQSKRGSQVHELPVKAKRCPMCGSARLLRIWTAPHVIVKNTPRVSSQLADPTGLAKATDKFTRPALEQAEKLRSDTQHAQVARRASPALAVPIERIGGHIAALARNEAAGHQVAESLASLGSGKARPVPAKGIIAGAEQPPVHLEHRPG